MIEWHSKKIKISELIEYEHNPRSISSSDFEKLIKHIKQDGYHSRIIINQDNTIIGGHQRKKALIAAGFNEDDTIDVLVPDRLLTALELDRINIRDNLHFGEYDFEILSNRFDLNDLADFGFTAEILSNFEKELLNPESDEIIPVDEQNTETKTKYGDLYICDNHKILCGDSTNANDVQKLLKDANPILMVTDPPYGVNYDPIWRDEMNAHTANTKKNGKILNDDKVDWRDAYSLFTGDVIYIWHASSTTHKTAEHIEDCGFNLINLIFWKKPNFVMSRGDYHHQHEPCWYAVKKNKKHNWQGARDQSTVWKINADHFNEQTTHSTQKPVECMLRPIINNTQVGESVYDPFGGSGTTLIAAERAKRNCYMIELSPHFVDIIIQRWERETNKKAVLVNG